MFVLMLLCIAKEGEAVYTAGDPYSNVGSGFHPFYFSAGGGELGTQNGHVGILYISSKVWRHASLESFYPPMLLHLPV